MSTAATLQKLHRVFVGRRCLLLEERERPLTRREREVLVLIAEGQTGKEIAVLLNISVKTESAHRHNLKEKLGIHNIAGLVRYAVRKGMVTP